MACPTDETTSWIMCKTLTAGLAKASTIWVVKFAAACPISPTGLLVVLEAGATVVADAAVVTGAAVVACLF